MLLALWLTLSAAPLQNEERTVLVDGKPLAVPVAAEAGGAALAVGLLVSSEERTLVATLVHRAWTPRDAAATPAHPEVPVQLGGRGPDLDLEHAGARIDERLRLLLWRRPERLRGLPLWAGVAVKETGVKPLHPPAGLP